MLDFNRANLSDTPLSVAINAAIERAEPPEENARQYLGASSIGSECLRKVQYDWMVDPAHPTQTRDIFRRGHLLEELSRQHFIRAGFKFAPSARLAFSAAGGLFRGHADGILLSAPSCQASSIHPFGSIKRSATKAGAGSSATGSRRLTRNTLCKS
jgi:hypothetical protein